MLSSRFAGIPISSSTIDEPGVPQLLNRGEQTIRAVTGSGGRLHFGMVAGIKSERWPTSNRNLEGYVRSPARRFMRHGRRPHISRIERRRGPAGRYGESARVVLAQALRLAGGEGFGCRSSTDWKAVVGRLDRSDGSWAE